MSSFPMISPDSARSGLIQVFTIEDKLAWYLHQPLSYKQPGSHPMPNPEPGWLCGVEG